ncbi:MAG: ABC transporter ATP-binding protein [Thermoplasmata archaeon]|nr:ABC transporter ATP-binding protein [Thermoplasmata archaeon]
MTVAIEVKGLTKYYGKSRGVEGLDMTVKKGEIYGFLGPNGAGKTTTIRVLLDLIKRTSGEARIFGLDVEKDSVEVRRGIGYLPGELGLYKEITGNDYLDHFQMLRGDRGKGRREELAKRFNADLDVRIKELSKGNKQKIGLIQAFDHDPQLLILDEPTSGLDPLMQQVCYALLKEEKERGKTILMSSHIISEVQHVCDRVGIINEGRMVDVEEIHSLKDKMGKEVNISFGAPVPTSIFDLPEISDVAVSGQDVTLRISGNMDQLVKRLAQHTVNSLTVYNYSLEELFLEYYGGGNGIGGENGNIGGNGNGGGKEKKGVKGDGGENGKGEPKGGNEQVKEEPSSGGAAE